MNFVRRYLGFLLVALTLAGGGATYALTPAQLAVLLVGCQQAAKDSARLLCNGSQPEPAGLAIDFTTADGLGSVTVKGHTTNLNNVPADNLLVQSGTSPKQVTWSDGLYRWTPHNLVLQSETSDVASWLDGASTMVANATAAYDGRIVAERIVEVATSNVHMRYQVHTAISGASYTYSVDIKAGERTWAVLRWDDSTVRNTFFDLTNGVVGTTAAGITASMTSLGNGWYRCIVSGLATAATMYLTVGPASADNTDSYLGDITKGLYATRAQLNRGTTPTTYHVTTTAAWYGVPIEYDPATAKFYGLVEPAATNLAIQSQAFDNAAWTQGNVTVSANAIASPDGLSTADKIIETTATNFHYLRSASGVSVANAANVFSIYAKKAERKVIELKLYDTVGTVASAKFDLNLGTVQSTAAGTAAIQSVGSNGWYRVSVTATTALAASALPDVFICEDDGTDNYTGDASKGLYIWQFQVELGAVATSPIPTFAATVTRAADNVNVATSAFPLSATAGTVIFEALTRLPSGDTPVWELYKDGNNYLYGSKFNRTLYVVAAGVAVADLSPAGDTQNTWSKKAGAFAANDFAAVNAGGAVSTDASGNMPTAATILNVGVSTSGSGNINGKIRSVVYVPRRMTNAELQARTT